MKKFLTNNALKVIAVVCMFIDHLGLILFPEVISLRIIGRISFPIFAFCIAEGLHYTRNRKKYVLTLLIFAIISQIPYYLIFRLFYKLNILFTFLISVLIIVFVEKYKDDKILKSVIIPFLSLIAFILILITPLNIFSYGIAGVATIMIFYFFRDKMSLKFLLFSIVMILYVAINVYYDGIISLQNTYQLFSLFSIVILLCYNNKRGRGYKYFFYSFYPVHLMFLWLVSIII